MEEKNKGHCCTFFKVPQSALPATCGKLAVSFGFEPLGGVSYLLETILCCQQHRFVKDEEISICFTLIIVVTGNL